MQKILNFIKKNKQFSFFFLLVILLIFVAVFAPVIAPQDPYVSDLKNALQAPNSEHWFGTDKLGRDIFSRVIYASRISLPATLTLVAIIFVAGTILGKLAGYFWGGGVAGFMGIFYILLRQIPHWNSIIMSSRKELTAKS